MVKPEQIPLLSTRMYELHQWYLREVKTTDRESLMVKVKEDHCYHAKDLWVEFQEMFLFLSIIFKSLASCSAHPLPLIILAIFFLWYYAE